MSDDTATEKPKAPTQQLSDIQLERIEKFIYTGQLELGALHLLQALKQLNAGSRVSGYTNEEAMLPKLYSRLVAAMSAMLCSPRFNLSPEGFNLFALHHPVTCALYESSVYDNSDHVAPLLAVNSEERDPAKLRFVDQGLPKWLLIRSHNSMIGLNYHELYSKAAKTMLASWIGGLSHRVVLHPLSHKRREEVQKLWKYFQGLSITDSMLVGMSDAFMYCSYATSPDRHDCKMVFSEMLNDYMRRHQMWEGARQRTFPLKDRPTILIIVEWMGSMHAMYRCYAPSIEQLGKKFHVVGMGAGERMDDKGRALFEEFINVDESTKDVVHNMVASIKQLRPDIIYYPSVGMNPWVTALSSWRLAPIQCMSLGHPATTHSPEMDYVFAEEGQIGDPTLHSEQIVWLPPNAIRFVWRDDANDPPPPDLSDQYVHVAVPGMICKVNVPFLEMLRRVVERTKGARRKPMFCFFPSVLGLLQYQTHKELKRWLGDHIIVYPRTDYNQYMRWMSRCSFQLSTYPFGGTNTNIDAFLLGMPIVCMEGDQPHEKFDALMLRRIGMHHMAQRSTQDYEDLVVKMIEDEAYLKRQRDSMPHPDRVREEFFGTPAPGTPQEDAFVRAMWRLYQHHEPIKASGKPVEWRTY